MKNNVLKYVKNKLVHQSYVYDFKLYNFLLLYKQIKINK